MNTTDAESRGIEIEGTVEINALSIRGTASHLFASEASPRYLANDTYSIIANYQRAKLNINLHGYFHGEMEQIATIANAGLQTITIPAHFKFNVTTRYAIDRNIALVGRIENPLDDTFRTPTRITRIAGLPDRGRLYRAGIEVKY